MEVYMKKRTIAYIGLIIFGMGITTIQADIKLVNVSDSPLALKYLRKEEPKGGPEHTIYLPKKGDFFILPSIETLSLLELRTEGNKEGDPTFDIRPQIVELSKTIGTTTYIGKLHVRPLEQEELYTRIEYTGTIRPDIALEQLSEANKSLLRLEKKESLWLNAFPELYKAVTEGKRVTPWQVFEAQETDDFEKVIAPQYAYAKDYLHALSRKTISIYMHEQLARATEIVNTAYDALRELNSFNEKVNKYVK